MSERLENLSLPIDQTVLYSTKCFRKMTRIFHRIRHTKRQETWLQYGSYCVHKLHNESTSSCPQPIVKSDPLAHVYLFYPGQNTIALLSLQKNIRGRDNEPDPRTKQYNHAICHLDMTTLPDF